MRCAIALSKPVSVHALQEFGVHVVSRSIANDRVDAAVGALGCLRRIRVTVANPVRNLRCCKRSTALEASADSTPVNLVVVTNRVFVGRDDRVICHAFVIKRRGAIPSVGELYVYYLVSNPL